MSRTVTSVAADTRIEVLTVLLLDHGIGCVPVVDGDGCVIGVISRSDVLRHAWEQRDVADRSVAAADIMMSFVFMLPPDASIARAAALMAFEGVTRLVVVRERRPIGIVSSVDVMRWLGGHADEPHPSRSGARVPRVHRALALDERTRTPDARYPRGSSRRD